MFSMKRRQSAPLPAPGFLQVPVAPSLSTAIEKIAQRWRCPTERAAERLLLLALTGWKLQYADLLDRLSRYVPGHDDRFRRTCMMLRFHFDKAEIEMGEAIRECDRVAWLETMLETLKDRKAEGEAARLADLLADGAVTADGGL